MNLNLKYRPSTIDQYICDLPIVEQLFQHYPNWPQAFLISGPAGVGKTTLARILADKLGCKANEVIEIDTAKDRGIEAMRSIIDEASHRSLTGGNKCYIFDEAHQITSDAQNALLKICEEPPKWVTFIFCTTNPSKIIPTLQKRLEIGRIDLEPLDMPLLKKVLLNVIKSEGIELTDEQKKIAKLCCEISQGIPRDAINFFEKTKDLDYVKAEKLIGYESEEKADILHIANDLEKGNLDSFIDHLNNPEVKNYESIRIVLGKIFKKKVMYSRGKPNFARNCEILKCFATPVNDYYGDLELLAKVLSV